MPVKLSTTKFALYQDINSGSTPKRIVLHQEDFSEIVRLVPLKTDDLEIKDQVDIAGNFSSEKHVLASFDEGQKTIGTEPLEPRQSGSTTTYTPYHSGAAHVSKGQHISIRV